MLRGSVLDLSAGPLLSQVTVLSSFPLAHSLPLLLRAPLCLPPADHSSYFPGTSSWQDPWRPPFPVDLTLPDGSVHLSTSGELLTTECFLLFLLYFLESDLLSLIHLFKLGMASGCWPTFAQT